MNRTDTTDTGKHKGIRKIQKIITVTLNPAIDRTVFVRKLCPGALNRVERVVEDAGGKGINVARTLQALGGTCLATGLLAREGSGRILESLERAGLEHDFILTSGTVRTNTKLAEEDGSVTELNETGTVTAPEDVDALVEKLCTYAAEHVLFVFAGSAPPGVDGTIYERLIEAVHQRGAKALLDADGVLFANGMKAVPDIVKPNRAELLEYFAVSGQGEGQIRTLGEKLLDLGVGTAMISCGADGALFFFAGNRQPAAGLADRNGEARQQQEKNYLAVRHPALSVRVCSTVGAGDAMTAAYCYCAWKGMDYEETAQFCMAVSAAAVSTEGTKPPERGAVEKLWRNLRQK